MNVKLLTEQNLEFLSFKGGCAGSSESTHVKMPHCWKSHIAAQIFFSNRYLQSSITLITRTILLRQEKQTNSPRSNEKFYRKYLIRDYCLISFASDSLTSQSLTSTGRFLLKNSVLKEENNLIVK